MRTRVTQEEVKPSKTREPSHASNSEMSQCSDSDTVGKVGETEARKGKTQKGIWEEEISSCSKQHII